MLTNQHSYVYIVKKVLMFANEIAIKTTFNFLYKK